MNNNTLTLLIPNNGRDFFEGCLNGQNFRIKTGEPVEVPISIANIVLESQRAAAVGKEAVAAYCQAGGKKLM
ncbi:MAG: hypothetical protein PHT58_04785 [Eubacteriales bacterium]|nr:hypothetical protein [Eubacteriales bacterium]